MSDRDLIDAVAHVTGEDSRGAKQGRTWGPRNVWDQKQPTSGVRG